MGDEKGDSGRRTPHLTQWQGVVRPPAVALSGGGRNLGGIQSLGRGQAVRANRYAAVGTIAACANAHQTAEVNKQPFDSNL